MWCPGGRKVEIDYEVAAMEAGTLNDAVRIVNAALGIEGDNDG